MQYITTCQSPVGEILLAADQTGLTGLWFQGEKYYALNLDREHEEREVSVFQQARRWLDLYFSGRDPGFTPPLHMLGTPFQLEVWKLLQGIPYGTTTTYGALARQVARQRGLARMSAQAVGSAVGRNELSLIVPCHRVVGSSGSLAGYAGGIDRKRWLLAHEGVETDRLFVPARSTAP